MKTVLSLFSGCGGMDLGMEGGFPILKRSYNAILNADWNAKEINKNWVYLPKTPFKVVFANDILREAENSWAPFFGSNGHCRFKRESIVTLVKNAIAGSFIFPKADIITGGFPCQDFSVAGKRFGLNSHKAHHGGYLSSHDNPNEENRGKLYMWMRSVVDIVRPKVFIAENVKGLVSLSNVKDIIQKDFSTVGDRGYTVVEARVLRAQDYGVPQTRERVIFYGFNNSFLKKDAMEILGGVLINLKYDPYPIATHGLIGDGNLLNYVSAKEAFIGLREPEAEKVDLSQMSYSKAKWYGRHCQGNKEIRLDAPGPTIRAEHHGNIEFRRLSKSKGGMNQVGREGSFAERRLTVRECARLQTFPDSFVFVRKKDQPYPLSPSDGYRVLGNAVPPLLAYHIAKRFQRIWPLFFKNDSV